MTVHILWLFVAFGVGLGLGVIAGFLLFRTAKRGD